MTRKLAVVMLGLSVLPLLRVQGLDRKGPKQSFEVTTTERYPFPHDGVIRLDNSYGYLTVEGWDEPEVEITVTKSTDRFHDPEWEAKASRMFDQVRVVAERPSDRELTISTKLPKRTSLFTSMLPSDRVIVTNPVPPNNKRGVTVEYRVLVPRDTRLAIHHDNGYVWVSGVTGDIEIHSHTGDMIVMLPDPGPYSIDAKTGLGSVTCDFVGRTRRQFPAGTHFVDASPTASKRVRLRMGRGSITIKEGLASGPLWKD